jgi:hypothetical protein
VSGVIRFAYNPPQTVKLKMSGSDTLRLDGDEGTVKTRDLLAVLPDPVVLGFEPAIFGTGKFRIKAKWHVDPVATLWLPAYRVLTVSLLRPDGTVAAEESGFSQHVSDDVINNYPVFEPEDALDPTFQSIHRRIDFGYTVRPEDIQNVDQDVDFWKVSVRGVPALGSGYPVVGSGYPVIDFDIDSGLDPAFGGGGFVGTFKAGCFTSPT